MLPRRFRRASTVVSHCFPWASTPPAPMLYPSGALSRLSQGLPSSFLPLRFPLASHRLRFLRDLWRGCFTDVSLGPPWRIILASLLASSALLPTCRWERFRQASVVLPHRFRKASMVLPHCFHLASTPPSPTLYPSGALSRLSLGLPWNLLPLRFPLASHRLRFLRDLLRACFADASPRPPWRIILASLLAASALLHT